MSLTRQLAELVVAPRHEDIPPEAVEVARQVCLDGLGVMIAGSREPLGLGRITLRYVRELGGTPESTVIAGGFKTNALNAAYANGTLCHALDFDNTWWPLNHPTSPTLPAILAVAERTGASGRDVLLALVLAFEVQGRLRLASERADTGKGFHKPGVSGAVGATTGVARLLGLDADRLCSAYGIVGSRCGSLSANTGTMTKSTHSGHAARMGVEAARLAQLGFTGFQDIFGAGQFFDLFYGPGRYDSRLLVEGFGAPYRMIHPGVGFKKYPSNYFTHRPIDAALQLRAEHGVAPEAIESVEVDMPDFDYVDRPRPASGLDGKFSVQYATALALVDGAVRIDSFSDERRFSADVEALLARVRVNRLASIPRSFNACWAVVRVRLRDGRTLEARCDRPRGIWDVPLSRPERLDKFRQCTQGVLSDEEADRVIGLVETLDEQPDVAPLMTMVGKPADGPA